MRKFLIALAASVSLVSAAQAQTPNTLLNVSYDISRELYAAINVEFAKQWKAKTFAQAWQQEALDLALTLRPLSLGLLHYNNW